MKTEKQLILDFLDGQKQDRITTLTGILKENGIDYITESCGDNCTNVVVSMTEEKDYVLLVAHHDLFIGSTGINDNTASMATLINVIHHLKDKKHIPFKVLFSDKEESGMVGSREYCKKHTDENFMAIVLDIIGYGETLVFGTKHPDLFKFLENYGLVNIKTILPSDNLIFSLYGIPTTLIVAAHDVDIIKTGEETDLTSYPKFYESFHNRAMDGKLEVINFDLVEKLRNTLISLLERKDEL